MPTTRVRAALADLTQDIAGPLPLELLRAWAAGPQDAAAAAALLEGHRLEGQVVATDTAGLTRMTEERDLLDVMALVSRPKEIVHGLGTAVGGRPIGVWVADNTEMFYPRSVPPLAVLDAMLEARARIAASLPIGIGMCLHAGSFYELGGGLYGEAADAVEALAEDDAGPGEILLTREWLAGAALPGECRPRPRPELDRRHAAGVFTLETDRRRPELREHDPDYPPPFPRSFLEALRRLGTERDPDALRAAVYGRYQRDLAVVFAAYAGEPAAGALAHLLDRLAVQGLVDSVVKTRLALGDRVFGSGSGYVIVAFTDADEALAAALALRSRLGEQGLRVSVGLDFGPVLAFEEPSAGRQIAGGPVNVASKLGLDVGVPGAIQVSDRAARRLRTAPGGERFALEVSAVRLTGVRL